MRLIDPAALLLRVYKKTNTPFLYYPTKSGMQRINIEEIAMQTPSIDSDDLIPYFKEEHKNLILSLENILHSK